MKHIIRGNKIEVTPAIKDYITDKTKRLERYFDKSYPIVVNAVVKIRGRDQIIEITIPTKNFTLRCEEGHEDLYAAIDKAIDKLERQIRKNKTKIKNKMDSKKDKDILVEFDSSEEETSLIVAKRKTIETKPMSEEEAMLQMELLDHSFFVYKDANSDNINVVYKRKEGNYGIIETK